MPLRKAKPVLAPRSRKPSQSDKRTLSVLERLAQSEETGAQARVSAARTLLEAQGAIGRHQSRPEGQDAGTSVGTLSREAMVRELARLRQRFAVR